MMQPPEPSAECQPDSSAQAAPVSARVLLFYANREKQPWPILPIGMSYVASALAARGHEIEVADLMFESDWAGRAKRAVAQFQPDIVGISIRNIDNVDWFDNRRYLGTVREELVAPLRASTSAPIVIGGPAVNIMPRRVLECVGADFAVFGDGEQTACALVEALKTAALAGDISRARSAAASLPGVVTVHNGAQEEGDPGRISDLNLLQSPEIFRWTDVRQYAKHGTPYSIQSKRGCGFRCSFCIYGQIEGRMYRLRDPEIVADEIAQARQQAGIRCFEFTDSVFNHPPGHAESICRALIARKIDATFTTSGVNPKFFTPELLGLMEEAGFEDFSFAPDSASPAVLADLGKGYTSADALVRAAEMVRHSRLPVLWWFTFGLPNETAATAEETLAFIRQHVRPSDVALCSVGVRILPQTRLAQTAAAEGAVPPNWDWVEPIFYEPRGIKLKALHAQVRQAALTMPNILLASETRLIGPLISLGIVLKRLFRLRTPLWQPVPKFNRVRNFFLRLGNP